MGCINIATAASLLVWMLILQNSAGVTASSQDSDSLSLPNKAAEYTPAEYDFLDDDCDDFLIASPGPSDEEKEAAAAARAAEIAAKNAADAKAAAVEAEKKAVAEQEAEEAAAAARAAELEAAETEAAAKVATKKAADAEASALEAEKKAEAEKEAEEAATLLAQKKAAAKKEAIRVAAVAREAAAAKAEAARVHRENVMRSLRTRSRLYLVVVGNKVTNIYHSSSQAVAALNRMSRGSSPSRMICEVNNGKVRTDPHKLSDGTYQGGGMAHRINKFWWNWPDIRRMNAIAQVYMGSGNYGASGKSALRAGRHLYIVVVNTKVTATYGTSKEAVASLNRLSRGSSPSRMICEANNGKVRADPHKLSDGTYQGGGLASGVNKWWWNWTDIRRMNAIAQAYLK